MSLGVAIRQATPEDVGWIVSVWANGMAAGVPSSVEVWAKSAARALALVTLRSPDAKALVAEHAPDRNQLGFVVGRSTGHIHWLYTKPRFRGAGVATILTRSLCGMDPAECRVTAERVHCRPLLRSDHRARRVLALEVVSGGRAMYDKGGR